MCDRYNSSTNVPHIPPDGRVTGRRSILIPSVCKIRSGDRVGICLASLDAKLVERGVVATPGSVRPTSTAIALVRKVGQLVSGDDSSLYSSRYHVYAVSVRIQVFLCVGLVTRAGSLRRGARIHMQQTPKTLLLNLSPCRSSTTGCRDRGLVVSSIKWNGIPLSTYAPHACFSARRLDTNEPGSSIHRAVSQRRLLSRVPGARNRNGHGHFFWSPRA